MRSCRSGSRSPVATRYTDRSDEISSSFSGGPASGNALTHSTKRRFGVTSSAVRLIGSINTSARHQSGRKRRIVSGREDTATSEAEPRPSETEPRQDAAESGTTHYRRWTETHYADARGGPA